MRRRATSLYAILLAFASLLPVSLSAQQKTFHGRFLDRPEYQLARQPSYLILNTRTDNEVLVDGATWLRGQQFANGGFPWTVGDATPHKNHQGAIARGVLTSYNAIGDQRNLDAAIRNGDYLINDYPRRFSDGDPDFFPTDPLFLEELTQITGDKRYSDFVRSNFWAKLDAGTYGENNNQDYVAWADVMPNIPEFSAWYGGTWIAFEPWFRAHLAVAAYRLGKFDAATAFMDNLLKKIEEVPSNEYDGDLPALGAAIWASAITGYDLDPKSGRWGSRFNSTQDIANYVVGFQRSGGDWPYDTSKKASKFVGDTGAGTWVMIGLKAWNSTQYANEIRKGKDFIKSVQQSNGQILTNPGYPAETSVGVEVHAEALILFATGDSGTLLPQKSAATTSQVAVKLFLEGPYSTTSGAMSTSINQFLPLTSPYSDDPRSVASIPANVVDWVLVQLRSTASGNAVAARSAFLRNDGRVVDDDGQTTEITINANPDNYFIVIKHRNHLAIMSANTVNLQDVGSTLYDFSTGQSKAYGGDGMTQLAAGVFGMIAGDGDADGNIADGDRTGVWRGQNGSPWEYGKRGDFNIDGGIDALDLNLLWRPNSGRSTRVPNP